MTRVRRLREDEWRAWRELRLRALADSPTAFGSTHEGEKAKNVLAWRRRTRDLATADDMTMFVAENATGFTGCGGVFVNDEGVPVAISMWIEPRQRGTGLGEAILEAILGWAAARGFERIQLLVTEGNRHARTLYERMGFTATGRRMPMGRDDLFEIEMERLLP